MAHSIDKLLRMVAMTVATAAVLSVSITTPAFADTLWDWSVNTAFGSGSGTITTSDSAASSNVALTITGIAGTFSDLYGDTFSISGLDTYANADNQFVWDGTNASFLNLDYSGFSFDLENIALVNIYFQPSQLPGGFGAANTINIDVLGTDAVYSSILAPHPGSGTTDPGPGTPEPATGILISAGIAGLIGGRRLAKLARRTE